MRASEPEVPRPEGGDQYLNGLERGLVTPRYPREQAVQVLVAALRTGHFRLGCTH